MTKRKLPRGVFVGKDGLYWIRYADSSSKIRREKVGPFVKQAGAAYQKRKSEVREGKFFPEQINRRVVLFGEIAKEYLTYAEKVKRDWHHDKTRVDVLLESLKGVPLAEMTPGRIEETIAELARQKEWTDSTCNRYRAVLSGVFRRAIKNRRTETNPVRETAHRKENNVRVRYLRDDEEADLMKALRDQWPEREAELLTALHSGMRRSEQFRTAQCPDGGLKWEHVDLRAGLIKLPRTKSGRSRAIPMNSVLRKTLAALPRSIASPYVFQGTDPGKWLGKAREAAKITDFTWHDLRHTFASRLAMAGVPIRHIAELMGHTELQTTLRYAHLAPGYLADAVERLAPQNGTATGTATSTKNSKASEKAS